MVLTVIGALYLLTMDAFFREPWEQGYGYTWAEWYVGLFFPSWFIGILAIHVICVRTVLKVLRWSRRKRVIRGKVATAA